MPSPPILDSEDPKKNLMHSMPNPLQAVEKAKDQTPVN